MSIQVSPTALDELDGSGFCAQLMWPKGKGESPSWTEGDSLTEAESEPTVGTHFTLWLSDHVSLECCETAKEFCFQA